MSPTIALLVGVFANGELFTLAHAVCFGCIWSGLALVAVDALRSNRLEQEQRAYEDALPPDVRET